MNVVFVADILDGRRPHRNGPSQIGNGRIFSYATYVGGRLMCKAEGCYRKWSSDYCPRCSIRKRRDLRRSRKQRGEMPGEQERLFGGSPQEQLRWWRNRK